MKYSGNQQSLETLNVLIVQKTIRSNHIIEAVRESVAGKPGTLIRHRQLTEQVKPNIHVSEESLLNGLFSINNMDAMKPTFTLMVSLIAEIVAFVIPRTQM